ncbi:MULTISPECIES: hypothetical protein [Paenibacillus]|nr:hypothetical protein [Paenibacillus rhizosphaerae]
MEQVLFQRPAVELTAGGNTNHPHGETLCGWFFLVWMTTGRRVKGR